MESFKSKPDFQLKLLPACSFVSEVPGAFVAPDSMRTTVHSKSEHWNNVSDSPVSSTGHKESVKFSVTSGWTPVPTSLLVSVKEPKGGLYEDQPFAFCLHILWQQEAVQGPGSLTQGASCSCVSTLPSYGPARVIST